MTTLREGDACPPFDLPEAGCGTLSSKALLGAPFVLYFYPKADTPGCTTEAIDFSALDGEFAALTVTLVGVSPDPVKKNARFRDKHDLKGHLVCDEDKALIGAFGLWVEKSMYGRTYMGVDRTTALIGADGRIAKLWPKVKVAGHATEVLQAATELAAK